MELRKLGNTDFEITPIGFGAWAIGGGGYKYGWGPQDDQDSINTIHRALDAGINWIDTASIYGLGHSEEVVGRALKGIADKPYVFSKGARVWDENRNVVDDQSAAGDSPAGRKQPAPSRRGRDRPVPDALALPGGSA